MKVLAVSDIHGNVEAVRLLRERERNAFDVVVVAGDIGGNAAAEILTILASFACPVLYVFGNWDNKLAYDVELAAGCQHLHLQSVECGGWAFAGFSGLPAGWGMNPIAKDLIAEAEKKHAHYSLDSMQYNDARRDAAKEALRRNRQELAKAIDRSHVSPRRTIVISHERLSRVEQEFADVPLFLFGHRHGFQGTTYKNAKFVNVSVLDNPATVLRIGKSTSEVDDLRNINVGNYTIIELRGDDIQARPVQFEPRHDGWKVVSAVLHGAPWLRAEDVKS